MLALLGELASQTKSAPEKRHLFSGDYVSRIAAAFPEDDAGKRQSPPLPGDSMLNEREMQVLRLLAAGLKTPEIAEELFLSKNTIKWYVRKL